MSSRTDIDVAAKRSGTSRKCVAKQRACELIEKTTRFLDVSPYSIVEKLVGFQLIHKLRAWARSENRRISGWTERYLKKAF
jgi:hypothetical protein